MSPSPVLASLRESLAADRAMLREAVARVPAELRARKPSPDRWSVQEVLEHLTLVEGRASMVVRALIEAAPGLEVDTAAGPTAIDRAVFMNRHVRIAAPDAIQPSGAVTADAAFDALERTRTALLAALDSAETRDLSKVTRPHPALGPLDGYQWIGAIGGHEMRHALQIDEIGLALSGTTS